MAPICRSTSRRRTVPATEPRRRTFGDAMQPAISDTCTARYRARYSDRLRPAVRDELGRHRCRENAQVDYDPTQYRGSAPHYLAGRPPYSAELGTVLARELGLDGAGHLLDVGCGPGVLAVQLAALVERVTALDPDAEMLEQARTHAASSGVQRIEFIHARAEDIADLGLAPMRLVTFGQSFHRTDRVPVAEAVYDLLEPGGAIVLVVHDPDAGPPPAGTGDPPIPDGEVQRLVSLYLGAERQSGRGTASRFSTERFENTLERTRFGRPTTIHAPGQRHITRDIDGVVSGYLSMSYAAPHLFGDHLDNFIADLRNLLEATTTTGRFWDWPGDTAAIIARKRSA